MKKYRETNHTIHYGDALEILRSEIDSDSIDLVFIDPPYNNWKKMGLSKGVRKMDRNVVRNIVCSGVDYINTLLIFGF